MQFNRRPALSAEAIPTRRRSRWGLYAPFLALAALAVAWGIAWFVIRDMTRNAVDSWIGTQAERGIRWSCADRTVGGFPFRIEIGCSTFTIDRPDMHVSVGRVLVVSQIYRPRHVIAEASGPLRVEMPAGQIDGKWNLLQASVIVGDETFDRLSIATEGAVASFREGNGAPWDLSSRRFEAHLRPDPVKPDAFDLSARTTGAVLPMVDLLVGGTETSDLTLGVTVGQAGQVRAGALADELDRWRLAGGRLDLTELNLVKGAARLQAKGLLWLDERHRPEGQLDLSAAGVGGLLGRLTGGATVTGSLLGMLLGVPQPAAPSDADKVKGTALRPLPPLRFQDGRLLVGPIPVPGIRLPALY